ncbi:hypothetical protein TNCV_571211 [Trichonephila clavipes]|nr:hypothetical protein TNCV_571211 [Trichonephila clavipes]
MEKKHQPTRAFCDGVINLRKQVARVERKATAGQVSQKKQPPVNLKCLRKRNGVTSTTDQHYKSTETSLRTRGHETTTLKGKGISKMFPANM